MPGALAFHDAHKPGLCSVAWLAGGGGGAALLTAGPDGRLCYRSAEAPGEAVRDISNTTQGNVGPISCLAAAPGRPVVTGDDNCWAKCYSHPEGEHSGQATRFALPVRALAYSPSGLTLAAGGDDEVVKLVDMTHFESSGFGKVFKELQSPYTRSLAYDPEGAYLAAVNREGSLLVWEIASGKQQLSRKKACPKADVAPTCRSQPAWHPDGGSLLAAPSADGDADVVLYERMSWETAFALGGQHKGGVSLLAFSKNGLYLVSAGATDQALVLWDVNERKCLEKRLLPDNATGLAWHPSHNSLAIITAEGQLAVWDGVVPSSMPSPTADLDVLNGIKKRGAGAGEAAPGGLAGDGVAGAAGGLDDGVSVLEGLGGTGTAAASDDYDREDSFLADSGLKRHGPRRGRRAFGGFGGAGLELPQPQDPIQSGSTELGESGRRYLAFSSLGCITLKQEEEHNVVEVTFHDTSRMRKRIPLLTDFFGFTLGALGEKGALYASRSSREAASTLVYRPYEAWADSDWTVALPKGEEAECAAAGSSFCAVATSRRQLRLFSQAGTQTHLITLPGAPVALAASGHQLAAVWHAGQPTAGGDQCLQYALFDVAEQRQLHAGPLPISPAATLSWLGFSEEGLLAAYDSEGELRLRSADFGGSWVTVFSAAAERKSTEQYWLVGLSSKEIQCIVCANSAEPSVHSGNARPVVTVVALRPPVVPQDAATAPFEADLVRHGVLLSHRAAAAADAKDGDEAAEMEAALRQAQLDADRISLRLIQKLLSGERHARALEAASTLHNLPALEGALKLANHHRATALAERISAFIEQRLAMEAAAAQLEEDEEEERYHADLARHGRQHGAVTPVPAPAFDAQQASPAAAATAGNMSRAASPAPRAAAGAALAAGSSNPFARKPTGELPENSPGNAASAAAAAAAAAAGTGAAAAKRKAPAGSNPFARKAKASKP